MKTFTDDALAALAAGGAITSAAVKIFASENVLVWGGYGTLMLDGEQYKGIGDNGFAQVTGGALGSQADNDELSLSGVDPDALAAYDLAGIKRAPLILWRLVFDASGSHLLDARIFRRGRIDQLPVSTDEKGVTTIRAIIEGAARGLGRSGQRMRTDADQRLVSAADGSMRFTSYAGERTLYWGGKVPQPVKSVLVTHAPIVNSGARA